VATPCSAYPSKAELLAALADAQARLFDRLATLGDARLSVPLPDARHRTAFPTVGHAVVHIFSAHAAARVGQLSVWRRAADHPPLSEAFV
jgi:hypothetical protein